MTTIWLIELTTRDRATGQTRTWRWGTTPGWQTRPEDDPALAVYEPRIVDPGNTEAHLFAPGTTRGRSVLGRGQIRLNNADGRLDVLAGHIADDGDLVVRFGDTGSARLLTDFAVAQTGKCRRLTFEGRELVLSWSDAQAGVLDRPIWTAKYGGSNVLPAGVDGTAADLKGLPIPEVWGNPGRRLPLPAVNTTRLIYQVSRRAVASIANVQDRGIALPIAATVTSLAALEAATVTSGTCQVYLGSATDGAYVRLGAQASGVVTCDAAEAASASTLADVVQALLTGPGGVPVGRLDLGSFAAVRAAEPAVTGWYSGVDAEDMTVGEALDALLDGAGAALIPDQFGIWRLFLLRTPEGTPRAVLGPDRVLMEGLVLGFNSDTDGLPATEVTVQYLVNFTPVSADQLASSVPADQVAFATQEARAVTAQALASQPRHPLGKPLTIPTRLMTEADAQRRADRARDLYCGQLLYATVPLHVSQARGLDRGDLVMLRLPRFPTLGLPQGRLMRIIGRVDERATGKTYLNLVG